MAGLSHAVLIIEAEQRSGTLITARLATEYNRDIFTVPGSIFSRNTEGPHSLIKLGATPITSSKDLIEALELNRETNPSLEILNELEKNILEKIREEKSIDEISEELKINQSKLSQIITSLEIQNII